MAKTKKKFKINTWYYLAGPFALCAYFLMDVIGGYNFPGYDWTAQFIQDLLALDSFSFAYAIGFAIIYLILTAFAAYCTYKYFKASKFNNKLKRGISMFLLSAVIVAAGTSLFYQPELGSLDKVKENVAIGTTTEVVDSDSDMTETTEVFSMDATLDNLSNAGEAMAHPLMIGNVACSVVGTILAIVAFVFIALGGFKKQGNQLFSALAIFCGVLVVYSVVAVCFLDANIIGLSTRFGSYSIVVFLAFLGTYIYVSDIKE